MKITQHILLQTLLDFKHLPSSALKGEWNDYLATECYEHNLIQIQRGVGHHNFQERYNRYVEYFELIYGRCTFAEVAVYSWPWNTTMYEIADDLVNSWYKSPGHWNAIINPNAIIFAFDMTKDPNLERWYGTGLLGEKLE